MIKRIFRFITLLLLISAVNAPQPRVLIIGDSISLGYTPFVQQMLAADAVVLRPKMNCGGTERGMEMMDQWLAIEGGKWDVIHFNFGLHDLKCINPKTGAGSTNPDDPRQATIEQYRKNLEALIPKMQAKGAKVIFATTTPFYGINAKVAYRDSIDVGKYNRVAIEVCKKYGVVINDLNTFVLANKQIMRPDDVHYFAEGSKALAEEVVKAIRVQLNRSIADGKAFNVRSLKPLLENPVVIKGALYADPSHNPAERVHDLIRRMPLEEKLALTGGYKNFMVCGLPRLGMRPVAMADASQGIHLQTAPIKEKSVLFSGILPLASTWNREIAIEFAACIAEQCRALGMDILLRPGVNIQRLSVGGRAFEYMGEDPYLLATMATAYMESLQKRKVITTPKHYIGNDQEFCRHFATTEMDDRWFDAYKKPVAFPFGYGLSYTTFGYENIRIEDIYARNGEIKVYVTVKNTAQREGREVVQVYVRDSERSVPWPDKELKAVEKVSLSPGESKTLSFTLNSRSCAFWDTPAKSWKVESREFVVLTGGSSVNLPRLTKFTINQQQS